VTADGSDAELCHVLHELRAEQAIARTLHLYCTHMDDADASAWAELFTEDGIYETRYPDSMEARNRSTQGRGALVEYVTRRGRSLMRHCVFTPVVEFIARDAAVVNSTWMVVREGVGAATIPAYGRYLDRMVRCEDGHWRFAHRIATIEYSGHSDASTRE
jgi:hypothetical protein